MTLHHILTIIASSAFVMYLLFILTMILDTKRKGNNNE